MDTTNGNGTTHVQARSGMVTVILKKSLMEDQSVNVHEDTFIHDLQKNVADIYGVTNPSCIRLLHNGKHLRFGSLKSNCLLEFGEQLIKIDVIVLTKPLDMSWNPTDCEVWVSKHFTIKKP